MVRWVRRGAGVNDFSSARLTIASFIDRSGRCRSTMGSRLRIRRRTASASRRSRSGIRKIRPAAGRRFCRRCISCSGRLATSRSAPFRMSPSVIGCTSADVEDVVSFYTMFYTRPVGQVRRAGVPHAAVRAARRRTGDRRADGGASAPNRTAPIRRACSR